MMDFPSGIGHPIALCLAKGVALLGINNVNAKRLRKAEDIFEVNNYDHIVFSRDATRQFKMGKMLDRLVKSAGSIDTLINNVGGASRFPWPFVREHAAVESPRSKEDADLITWENDLQ